MPEKAKLKAVCETAVAAVQQAYPEPEQLDDVPPFDGGTETAVELLVRNQAVDNTISVEDVRTRMEEQYPLPCPLLSRRWRIPAWSATTGSRSARPASKAGKPQL